MCSPAILLLAFRALVPLGGGLDAPAFRQDSVAVPVGEAITLDGHIEAGEWDDAVQLALSGGGVLFLKRSGPDVLLAIRSTAGGFASVGWLIADSLRILHASTGLISASYRPGLQGWSRTRPFDGPVMADGGEFRRGVARQSVTYQVASYEQWGWTATVVDLPPPTEMEYRIRVSPGVSPRLAVAFRQVRGEVATATHPTTLADAMLDPDLLQGTAPSVLDFRPETWTKVLWEDGTWTHPG